MLSIISALTLPHPPPPAVARALLFSDGLPEDNPDNDNDVNTNKRESLVSPFWRGPACTMGVGARASIRPIFGSEGVESRNGAVEYDKLTAWRRGGVPISTEKRFRVPDLGYILFFSSFQYFFEAMD